MLRWRKYNDEVRRLDRQNSGDRYHPGNHRHVFDRVRTGSNDTLKGVYMKALSIQQPFAWLIVNGYKDIENRTWNTNYKGFVLIHAGKQVDGTFFADDGKTLWLPRAEN